MAENDDIMSALESAWDTTTAEPAAAPPPAEPAPPAETSSGPVRDEYGRFAPKAAEPEQAAPADAAATSPTQPASAPVTKEAASGVPPVEGQQGQTVRPPPGWSPTAKAEFDKLPEAVKQAVVQREVEVNNGFAKLQEYKPIEPYVDWARQMGYPLNEVIERYRSADQMLNQNFEHGLMWLCNAYNRDPVQIAGWIMQQAGVQQRPQQPGQPPQQQAQPQQINIQNDPVVRQMWDKIRAFEEYQQAQVMDGINAKIAQFAEKPEARFFDNVVDRMADLISKGQATTIEDAYEQACWLNPEIRQILINEERAKTQSQPALPTQGRTPTAGGSPLPNVPPESKPKKKDADVFSDLEEAWRELAPSI
jgi:hypothetical protein